MHPLVPDVAYVDVERLRDLEGPNLQTPPLAPNVVAEILSPDDRRIGVDDKIATYLAAGSGLAIVVDRQSRTVELHDPASVAHLTENDVLVHAALPGFELPLRPFFAKIGPPGSAV
jgi:Uma2 family endonuclease